MKEVGSEFAISDFPQEIVENSVYKWISGLGYDQKFLFSGRTAIDYVLQDVQLKLNSVYMPSYCCNSMLQPFIDRGIEIEFYNVAFEDGDVNYEIDYTKQVDLFFGMSYFGFDCSNMDAIISSFRMNGVIVIEDITHRLFSTPNHCVDSNYLVASIRKWLPVPTGGVAIKLDTSFNGIRLKQIPAEVLDKKVKAMKKKNNYLINKKDELEKREFLALFSDFNTDIKKLYRNRAIDFWSERVLKNTDISKIRIARIQNALYVYNNFKDNRSMELIFNKLDPEKDCPLFIPIRMRNNTRNQLKEFFVGSSIYCPIHWPLSEIVDNDNNVDTSIYEQEISLICDQRYGLSEMQFQLDKVGEFEAKL